MQKIEITSEKSDSKVNDSLNALKELQELSGRLPEDFDYEKELQEVPEEKYVYKFPIKPAGKTKTTRIPFFQGFWWFTVSPYC